MSGPLGYQVGCDDKQALPPATRGSRKVAWAVPRQSGLCAPDPHLPREPVLGIFSWFRSRSHVRDEEIKRAADADVTRIQQDDKYFDSDSPGSQEDDL